MAKKKKTAEVDSSILSIDPDRLDEEWINQPEIFFEYAQKKAGASRRVDEAKAELEVVEAELAKAIRNRPERFGLSKITDKGLESVILMQDDYITARQELTDAKYELDLLDAMVKALHQRKSALENLVDLHGQSYFASPRESENSRGYGEEARRKETRRGQAIDRRKRKKDEDEEDEE